MLHHYENYRWLRGFNIIPSWGARIEQAWWDYDGDRFREEAALATQTHANCLRLWIEFTAWMADPAGVQASFMDAVTAIDELGLKTMPCLFNRWHDRDYDYGGTYHEDLFRNLDPKLDYVRALVTPLTNDPRILIWDLCNEPGACQFDDPVCAREIHWLSRVADIVRQTGAQQPITIGTQQSGQNMNIYAPLCDVLGCHPYGSTPEQLAEMLVVCAAVQSRHGKPMLSNETVPGCLDDVKRAACAKWTIRMMEDAGYGWMGWGMHEGLAVSTRRDRFDSNGIDGQGFHAWFNNTGKLRPGLEFLGEPPRFVPPWSAAGLAMAALERPRDEGESDSLLRPFFRNNGTMNFFNKQTAIHPNAALPPDPTYAVGTLRYDKRGLWLLFFNRAGYLWSAAFYFLASLVAIKVYFNWKQKQNTDGVPEPAAPSDC